MTPHEWHATLYILERNDFGHATLYVLGRNGFVVLGCDDLDKVGMRCHYCEQLISYKGAHAAVEIDSTTSGRTAYIHGQCARRKRVLG